MQQPTLTCRIPSDWMEQVQDICQATGQTPRNVARETLAAHRGEAVS